MSVTCNVSFHNSNHIVRLPVALIDTKGIVEVMVPKNAFPSARAGLTTWILVRTLENGSKFYQATVKRGHNFTF